MFSQVSVCPRRGGVSATHLPWADTPHPLGRHPTRQTLPQCMLGYTPPAQCMLGYTPRYYGIRSTSGRYASHWNAFLLKIIPHYINSGFNFEKHYLYQEGLHSATQGAEGQGLKAEEDEKLPRSQYAVLELEKPVTCSTSALVIGSKLDTDIHSNICRIAFHGAILEAISDLKYTETVLPKLKVFKNKFKEGIVERKTDENSVVCRGLFKKETNIETFVGMKVKLSTGEQGSIEGGFGQSGKLKVRIPSK